MIFFVDLRTNYAINSNVFHTYESSKQRHEGPVTGNRKIQSLFTFYCIFSSIKHLLAYIYI